MSTSVMAFGHNTEDSDSLHGTDETVLFSQHKHSSERMLAREREHSARNASWAGAPQMGQALVSTRASPPQSVMERQFGSAAGRTEEAHAARPGIAGRAIVGVRSPVAARQQLWRSIYGSAGHASLGHRLLNRRLGHAEARYLEHRLIRAAMRAQLQYASKRGMQVFPMQE